jgi:membrane protease YdiL (CAAX protease family)
MRPYNIILIIYAVLIPVLLGFFFPSESSGITLLPSYRELNLFPLLNIINIFGFYISFLIIVCIIAPVIEEFIFRKVLQGYITKKTNIIVALCIVSPLFSIVHLPAWGWVHVIALLIPSFLFGYAYYKDEFIGAVKAHAIFNFCGVMLVTFNNLF